MAMRHVAVVDVANRYVLHFPGKLLVEIRSRAPRGFGERRTQGSFFSKRMGSVAYAGKVWQEMEHQRWDGTKQKGFSHSGLCLAWTIRWKEVNHGACALPTKQTFQSVLGTEQSFIQTTNAAPGSR